jgi:DNA-directed RNA polymerase subunit RPC12/RpoP
MIRFKCIYCGQRILAPDNGAGKKGKCPKCGHLLTVPEWTKGRPAIDPDFTEQTKQSTEEVAKPSPIVEKTREAIKNWQEIDMELYREKAGWLIPTYDGLSLFLMAVTWIVLYLINNHLRQRIHTFLYEANDWRVSVLALTIPAILILGIYQVFTKRKKSEAERTIMLWFAITTNILTGIIAGIYLLKTTELSNLQFIKLQLIFPVWNIVNAGLLYLMLEFDIINENCIIDREAKPAQIMLSLAAVIIIASICNYVFKFHWSITFSICIIWTTSFDRALQSVFGGLSNIEESPS